MLGVNRGAARLCRLMAERWEELGVKVDRAGNGATVIDAGVEAKGGFEAGRLVTEICMGGLGSATLTTMELGGTSFPAISVYTDHPAVALLGAQFAGWRIKVGDYFAMGSGPARALSLKPRELYEKIGYRDEADEAVMVLEADKKPGEEALEYIAKECGVKADRLYVVVTPTSSVAGSTQISGRIVETGLHRLTELGFDPKKVLYGCGVAPIAPIHPKSVKAMGRTNDMLMYAGATFFMVDAESDEELKTLVEKAPSSSSKDYGKPFYEIFKDAGFDFYKIDPALFAPAMVTVNNVRTGSTFTAGKLDVEIFRKSLGL